MAQYNVKDFAKKLVVNGDEVTFTTTLSLHDFIQKPAPVEEDDIVHTFETFIYWFFSKATPDIVPNSLVNYWQELVPDGVILYGADSETHPRLRFIRANKQLTRVTVQFILTTENVGRWLIRHNFPQMSYAK